MRVLPVLALLVATSCAHGPPAQLAAAVNFPGARRELSISGNDLFGSEIHLRRDGQTFRGDAYGQLVELKGSDGHVKGTVGSAPVDLTAETKDGVTTVRGLFMAELSDLRVSAAEIEGKIGACSYEVKSADAVTYTGYRSCRSPTEATTVSVNALGPQPLDVAALPPLLLLLAR